MKSGKKILIIGNLGYVGIPLVKHLKNIDKSNHKIYGLDKDLFFLNDYAKHDVEIYPDLQIYKDCRKVNLKKIPTKIDVVIYLAAVSNDPMGNVFKKATEDINFQHCIKLAQQAKNLKVKKFIFASSCSMYGASGDNLKKETDKLNPLTDYAISKVKAEQALKKMSDKNFKTISLRFATAAGFSQNLRLDLVFNDFIASAVYKKKIELLSAGSSWRPLIHVNDMARAIAWAVNFNNSKFFLPINVGSKAWNFRIIDLAKKIAKIIGNVKVVIKDKNAVDKRSYKVDFTLFNKLAPNFKPETNFRSSVIELKNFCIKHKKYLHKFRKSPKWSRLSALNHLIDKKKLNKDLYWVNKYD
jgi:nucleoside-diphosphate-sugar epimerase|tara:strand:- start:2181 stop:3248 length:1068 start_codon:yes stop_codon:yes gene_type:complete